MRSEMVLPNWMRVCPYSPLFDCLYHCAAGYGYSGMRTSSDGGRLVGWKRRAETGELLNGRRIAVVVGNGRREGRARKGGRSGMVMLEDVAD